MNRLQFIALLTPAIGSLVLVLLSWINANARASRLEVGLNQLRGENDKTRAELRGDIDKARSDLRGEIDKARSELRGEIVQLRGEVSGLRDMVYREMVSLHERLATVEAKHP